MKSLRDYILEVNDNLVIYKHDGLYDDFLEKISLLPEDKLKELIKKYNRLKANNMPIDINKLLVGGIK